MCIRDSRCSGGDGASPAGARLTDSSLIDPHGDVLWAEAAYELEVHTVREVLRRLPSRRRMKRQLVETVRETHGMRIADISRHGLELGSIGTRLVVVSTADGAE